MSSSDRLPKQIEDVLVTHRRGFLKSAGLLAVSFGVFGATGIESAEAQSSIRPNRPVLIAIPISTRLIRGL